MKLSLNEIAKRIRCSNGCVRNWSLKINVGDVYTENYCNVNNIKANIRRLYNNDENKIEEALGCKIDELEVQRFEKRESNYIDVDELVENTNYIIKHYHHETEVRFVSRLKIENNEVYVFDKDGKYVVYTTEQLDDDKLNIKEV